jgi:hypothetical protein
MYFYSPRACHMPRPSHLRRVGHPNNIWRGTQMTEIFTMQYYRPLPAFCVHLAFSAPYFYYTYINVYKFWMRKFLFYTMSLLGLRRRPTE